MAPAANKLSLVNRWSSQYRQCVELDEWGQREEAQSIYQRCVEDSKRTHGKSIYARICILGTQCVPVLMAHIAVINAIIQGNIDQINFESSLVFVLLENAMSGVGPGVNPKSLPHNSFLLSFHRMSKEMAESLSGASSIVSNSSFKRLDFLRKEF